MSRPTCAPRARDARACFRAVPWPEGAPPCHAGATVWPARVKCVQRRVLREKVGLWQTPWMSDEDTTLEYTPVIAPRGRLVHAIALALDPMQTACGKPFRKG